MATTAAADTLFCIVEDVRFHVSTEQGFQAMRELNRIQPGVVYRVDSQYAVTPDGIGCYWYDTLGEAIDAL